MKELFKQYEDTLDRGVWWELNNQLMRYRVFQTLLKKDDRFLNETQQYTESYSVFDDDGDIFERLASTQPSGSAEDAVIRMVSTECLGEEFLQLSKKEQDILGRYLGIYSFPKADLQEIAVRNLLKVSGVEKAKEQTLKHLRDRYRDSFAWKLRQARRMVALVVPQR